MADARNITNLSIFNRAEIMRRAWALFRTNYDYRGAGKGTPFLCIGRKCLAWCIKEAWRLAKEAARIAAIPAVVKAERIAWLKIEIEKLAYLPFGIQIADRRDALESEIRKLAA